VHKGKSKISLVSAKQAKKLISSSKKYVFLFLRENQFDDESIVITEKLLTTIQEMVEESTNTTYQSTYLKHLQNLSNKQPKLYK
jgi:hypothetical protein